MAEITQLKEGQLQLSGDLLFDTVPKLADAAIALLIPDRPLTIDLAAVERCDSAGLVLLLELLQHATAIDCRLQFYALPRSLLEISRLSGAEELLPVAS